MEQWNEVYCSCIIGDKVGETSIRRKHLTFKCCLILLAVVTLPFECIILDLSITKSTCLITGNRQPTLLLRYYYFLNKILLRLLIYLFISSDAFTIIQQNRPALGPFLSFTLLTKQNIWILFVFSKYVFISALWFLWWHHAPGCLANRTSIHGLIDGLHLLKK